MDLYSFGSHRFSGLKFEVVVRSFFFQIERRKEVEIFESNFGRYMLTRIDGRIHGQGRYYFIFNVTITECTVSFFDFLYIVRYRIVVSLLSHHLIHFVLPFEVPSAFVQHYQAINVIIAFINFGHFFRFYSFY